MEAVAPIQLAIRLLIPAASRLLGLPEIREIVGPFDAKALVYPWKHTDPALDRLSHELQEIVAISDTLKRSRSVTFEKMWRAVRQAANQNVAERAQPILASRATVPYLNEPWYC